VADCRRGLALGATVALAVALGAAAAIAAPSTASAPTQAPSAHASAQVGCRAAGTSFRLAGPSARRLVALTFDDGPGPLTPAFLDVLERERVPATFFPVGRLIAGQEPLLRRMLAGGSTLGNHTFTHAHVATGGRQEMLAAQGTIRAATGYVPCVFRAPANKHSPLLVREARALGMNTVQWSVDSRDWTGHTARASWARVTGLVHPGAVVLFHDGGRHASRTLAALPHVIRSLRARGYRFVTVPALLALAPRYG
jgi:peptidoglycan-N-acetylglucosamine deacetylase